MAGRLGVVVDRCDLGGWIGRGCRWVGVVGEWTGG